MLRCAICLAHQEGPTICAPIHDAVLAECDVADVHRVMRDLQRVTFVVLASLLVADTFLGVSFLVSGRSFGNLLFDAWMLFQLSAPVIAAIGCLATGIIGKKAALCSANGRRRQ
jgi:hypothetical protein